MMYQRAIARPTTQTPFGYSVDLSTRPELGLLTSALERASTGGADWVTFRTSFKHQDDDKAIKTAIALGFKVVVWLPIRPIGRVSAGTLAAVCRRWSQLGLEYVSVFDCPNLARSWAPKEWVGPGLVHKYVEVLAPVLDIIQANGPNPVLAPLAPRGDYWDLTFLGQLLGELTRVSRPPLLDRLNLGVFDVVGQLDVEGSFAADAGPSPQPYRRQSTADRTSEMKSHWYDVLAREHLGQSLPQLALDLRWPVGAENQPTYHDQESGTLEAMTADSERLTNVTLPPYRCNVSLGSLSLTSSVGSSDAVADPIAANVQDTAVDLNVERKKFAFERYLLLCPSQANEAERWSLSGLMNAIVPYVGRFRPTVGFSVDEAARAGQVTIVGPDADHLLQIEQRLQGRGCQATSIPADSVADLKRKLSELA